MAPQGIDAVLQQQMALYEKLAAQVGGLELVIKALIAMHITARVKGQEDFSKGATMARETSKALQRQVARLLDAAPPHIATSTQATEMVAEMSDTVQRCFAEAEKMMEAFGEIALDLSDPASDAKQ